MTNDNFKRRPRKYKRKSKSAPLIFFSDCFCENETTSNETLIYHLSGSYIIYYVTFCINKTQRQLLGSGRGGLSVSRVGTESN